MEISYKLTEDDYRQAIKAFRKRTAYRRWSNRFVYVCFALLVPSALFLTFSGGDRSFSNLFPLWLIIVFWVWYLWYCPYRVARKMINGSPGASLPYTADISEKGLYLRTSATESRLAWDVLVGWAEAERVFALFPSPLSFFPIPKRAMTSEQQNEFRELLSRNIKGRKL